MKSSVKICRCFDPAAVAAVAAVADDDDQLT